VYFHTAGIPFHLLNLIQAGIDSQMQPFFDFYTAFKENRGKSNTT